MIAYHYAEPLERMLVADVAMHPAPAVDTPVIAQLKAGDRFILLDDSLGWGWGYGGSDRRVGYVRSEAFGAD